jgi:hypothetical protein
MPASEIPEPTDLPSEITKSFTSVWRQYAGEQPGDAQTEIEGDVVRCVLKDAVGGFDKAMLAAQSAEAPETGRPLTQASFRMDAVAAVTRVTRRRVLAFVSDHDAKTGVAREVFILEPRAKRY